MSDSDSTKTFAVKALHSVLLVALAFGLLSLGVVAPFFAVRKPAAAAFWAAIVAGALVCLFLLRRGYVRLSSWVFLSTVWISLALFVVLSGGIRSPGALSHIAVIVVAVWLLGRREAIWVAVLSLGFGLSLAILETVGVHLPRYFPVPPIAAWGFAVGLVCLTILPLTSVNRALADSVEQARRELEARRREERARAETEERFRATFFQAAVGIAQTSLDGRWLLLNDRLCGILGYTRDQLIQGTFLEITHPDDREASQMALRRLLAGDISSWPREQRYIHKDGATVWGRVFTSLVRDQQNQPQYFITVVEDISEKNEAERALQETEQRLTLALHAAHLGVWDWDLSNNGLTVSGEFADLHGVPPERTPVTVDDWISLIHPDDREQLLAVRNQCLDGAHAWDTEYRVIWPDHSVHWLRSKGSVVLDDSGGPAGATGVCMDVTERKQAEETLRSSRQRLELAQSAAGIASYERDLDTGAVRCSNGFPALYGLPPSEVGPSYQQWLECIHPEDRAMATEHRARTLEGGNSWEMEFRVVWPDGSVHWLLAKGILLRDSQGHPTRTVGVNMDITERKQAEGALRSSLQRLELAQAACGVASYDRDLITNVGSCTELFPALYGLPPAKVGPPYDQWLEIIHPDDRDSVHQQTIRMMEGDGSCDTEFRVVWPDGSVHWLLGKGMLLRDSQGNPSRLVGVNVDISERKRAADESVARQKLESLGVLASGVAHDFNNMLGSILAELELLLDEVSDRVDARTAVFNIMAVVNRAAGIVRELMAYAGNEEAVLEPTDLSTLVREMLQLLKVSICKQAVLETDLPEGLPHVRASAAQMAQLVMNLITNASEALGEQPGVISVNVRQSEGHIRLAVSDTGCGMTEEVRTRIFDPFFSTKFAGRGLGLAAVQGIIRKHGGTIKVASVPGRGSLFTVLLPVTNEPAPDMPARVSTPSDSSSGGSSGTVLVIEDEEALRLAVSKILRKRRFHIIEASDGRAGVDMFLAHQQEIDAVLLDMTLPGLSGREVLTELRRIQPDVKVILTTAYSEERALAALGGRRPWRFLRKPYRLDELAELLRDACQHKRQ